MSQSNKNYVLLFYFNILAARFRHKTIIRPSWHKIQDRLHVVYFIFNVVRNPIKLKPELKILVQQFNYLLVILPVIY